MKLFILIMLLLATLSPSLQKSGKLKVSLYYEALCPDCSGFIIHQLYPDYQKIGPYLVLDLVPYGNAHRQKVNGTWHFQCQHGPPECALNKIEACGLSKSTSQEKDIEFVNCIETKASPNANLRKLVDACAPILGLSSAVILKCSQGAEGNDILARMGQRTDAVAPRITEVPTICFNDVNNPSLDNDARRDFLGTACKLLQNKPRGCPGSNTILN